MVEGARRRVAFRRRRQGRTDYRRRLGLLRSGLPRAVVRKSLNQVRVQVVAYTDRGDQVLAAAVSRELKRFGWTSGTGNVAAAYLTGYLAGRRAARKGVGKAVLDLGVRRPSPGGRLFAAARGLLDAGIDVPHGPDVLPPDDRIRGGHLDDAVPKLFEAVRAKLEEA